MDSTDFAQESILKIHKNLPVSLDSIASMGNEKNGVIIFEST